MAIQLKKKPENVQCDGITNYYMVLTMHIALIKAPSQTVRLGQATQPRLSVLTRFKLINMVLHTISNLGQQIQSPVSLEYFSTNHEFNLCPITMNLFVNFNIQSQKHVGNIELKYKKNM